MAWATLRAQTFSQTSSAADELGGGAAGNVVRATSEVLEPEQVAGVVVEGIRAERFLLLPHPEVAEFERRRAADRDRWLAGMRRARSRPGRA